VQLSPIKERVARVLVEAGEGVVPEDDLLRRGWPTGDPTANALRVHLHRLRRRVEYLGLEIRSVRSSGWILQLAADNGVSMAG
jgi:DNA-binding response OmpR family regulator